MTPHILGASAAIAAAFFWAVAAFLFRHAGAHVAPLTMNFVKGAVSLCCLAVLLGSDLFLAPPAATFAALALSGVIGIALGDTLYFYALRALGARRTLVTTTLVPVVAALGGWVWFGDALTVQHAFAMTLVLGGVAYVLWERSAEQRTTWRLAGIAFGVVYITAEAAGILLTKFAVAEWSALHASMIRQVCASIAIGMALAATRKMFVPRLPWLVWRTLLLASFAGAFLGTWLSVEALKYTHTAVATTLSSTSPLFAIPIAMIWERERVTKVAMIATLVATAGVAILFYSG